MTKKIWMLSGVVMLLLTGCGREESLEVFVDTRKTVEEEGSIDEDDMIITSHEELLESMHTVDDSRFEKMNVYRIEKVEVNDEYLSKLANTLFDDGKYELVFPYSYWDRNALEEERKKMEKQNEEKSEDGLSMPEGTLDVVLKEIREGKQKQKPELAEGQLIYTIPSGRLEPNGEEPMQRCSMMRGNMNGRLFQLEFYELDGAYCETKELYLKPLFPISNSMSVPMVSLDLGVEDTAENTTSTYDTVFGDNTCELDDAKQQAYDFMKILGYDDFTVDYTAKRICKNENTGLSYQNGYDFYFTRVIDNAPIPLLSEKSVMREKEIIQNELGGRTKQEYIVVTVDDTGVIMAEFGNWYEVKDVLTEKPAMIPFEKVQEIANEKSEKETNTVIRDYIRRHYEFQIFGATTLTYIPLEYEESIVYMPVWLATMESMVKNNSSWNPVVVVNALDGEIIYMMNDEEEY